MYYNMESLIKQTREVGTSAGVLLPRNWLNKQVVVTLVDISREKIAQEVLTILFKYKLNKGVKGIYLFGSYARGDYDMNSDIDILVITDKANKIIKDKNYEILLVSESIFSNNLTTNLNYSSILSEAETIFNKELIEKYISKKLKFNSKNVLNEIKGILKINEDIVKVCREHNRDVPDGIVYSIVLRLRELYLIKCLFSGKKIYKKDIIEKTGEKIYSAYTRIKRDERELNNTPPDELLNILNLSEKWLKELKE